MTHMKAMTATSFNALYATECATGRASVQSDTQEKADITLEVNAGNAKEAPPPPKT